ncbi:MAG: insulinase family protein, partial [Myxococcota bacterium]|nr:insulinase family protein [Myxococcota bacterium]
MPGAIRLSTGVPLVIARTPMRSSMLAVVLLPALVLVVGATTSASAQYADDFPDPQRFTLRNGLEVVLDPVPARREVTVLVSYHVGTRDQPRGWTGLAHLTEHLMFEGSLHAPGGYIETLERAGSIDRNATTSVDRTEYFQTVPSSGLETVLFLESDRMAYLLSTLDQRGLEEQRRVVERERIERQTLSERGLLPAFIARALYPIAHPYRDVIEVPGDLAAISLPHVQWFVQSWYQPANATLVISGGFDPALARALVERWFGSLRPASALPARATAARVRLDDELRMVIAADTTTDQLRVVWPTPAYGAPGDAELDVIAHVLTERLQLTLVEQGLALAAWARQSSHQLCSEFTAGALVPHERGTAEALAAIDAELARLEQGVDPALVRRVQEVWLDRLVAQMEHPAARAGMLALRMYDGAPYTVAREA